MEALLLKLLSLKLKIVTRALIWSLRLYQKILSPLLGPNCRFFPTCSEYAIVCLQRYKLFTALRKILLRILKCNPYHKGGEDLP